MKPITSLPTLVLLTLPALSHTVAQAISIETAPPVVVKTVPIAGATAVDPALTELRVTYSKPMQDGSWSWSTWGEENFPETSGAPRYLPDGRTCVLPVKLEPDRFYATWLNSDKFHNFQDRDGRPAVPYLLTFTTGAARTAALPKQRLEAMSGELLFQGRYRHRSRGREIETPSELWLKATENDGLVALAHLPWMGTWEEASGNIRTGLTRYRTFGEASGDRPAYLVDLTLSEGRALLTRQGIREERHEQELEVPSGASFDPNTRPDAYCAANILVRAFDLQPGETRDVRMFDWDNSGEALASYTVQLHHAGKDRVEVPAGVFEANHLVLKQLTSADTWFKKRAGHLTDFWVLDNNVILRVLRHREPYEMVLLDYQIPEQLDAFARVSTEDVQSWVKAFFSRNYRDITSRNTLEWGDVTEDPNGNFSIRYKYRARIWDRETITNHQVFTFDPEGRFLSVEDASTETEGD